MNDEIKEILEKPNVYSFNDECYLYFGDYNKLKDYITNLQQENERLKELVNPKTQIFIDTQDMEERYGEELYKEYLEKQVKDYKSRIEKAVEYINNNTCKSSKLNYKYMNISDEEIDDLLNILMVGVMSK